MERNGGGATIERLTFTHSLGQARTYGEDGRWAAQLQNAEQNNTSKSSRAPRVFVVRRLFASVSFCLSYALFSNVISRRVRVRKTNPGKRGVSSN
jgi:hypothetical protein